MQDIDFDEIDRAVSSVTNSGVPKRENIGRIIPTRPVAPVATTPAPVPETPIETPAEAPTPAPAASTPSPAARRSSGRFMDVVHSSSDMRPVRSSAPAAASLHREEVVERTEVASRPEPVTTGSSAFHWPDPIDALKPSAPTPEPEPIAAPVFVPPAPVEVPIVPDPVVEEFVPEEPSAPLESPFLANANIEKRPLGAFSDASSDLPLIEDPIPFSGEDTAESEASPEISKEVEALLAEPIETQSDLNDEALPIDEHFDEAPEEEIVAETEVIATPVAEVPAGPTSITQQYKEQPSTTDAGATGSIYDTEAYHQPLVHTPKKHSGVLVVVWIISLILVGGGIGAGVYFVLLPMLG